MKHFNELNQSELNALTNLSDNAKVGMYYDWYGTQTGIARARSNQIPPSGDWRTWLICAGRGFGKSVSGAQWVRHRVETGAAKSIAMVGPTAADVRDTMVEGPAGILAISPPWFRPKYESSKARLTWPNGAVALLKSAEDPNRLRGPNLDSLWCDEIMYWQHAEHAFDVLLPTLRLGLDPRCVVTTTPKKSAFLRKLEADDSTIITTGTTYDNRDNLAPAFFTSIIKRYEGTRFGDQELLAIVHDEAENALWRADIIQHVSPTSEIDFKKTIIGVDPAVTDKQTSDEIGIVSVGLGQDNNYYVLADKSLHGGVKAWAEQAIWQYHTHNAAYVAIESNMGGNLLINAIHTLDNSVKVELVPSTRSKSVRAAPVVTEYERGMVYHIGTFPELEEQMLGWESDSDFSPDRLDALCIALNELIKPKRKILAGIA